LQKLSIIAITLATAIAQAGPQTTLTPGSRRDDDIARLEEEIAGLQRQQQEILKNVRRELAAVQAKASSDPSIAERRRKLEALLAEIERRINEEKDNKTRYLSPGTKDPDYRAYYQRFGEAVIARGNTYFSNQNNTPDHGQVVVNVTLRNGGRIESVEVMRTTSPDLATRVSEMLKAVQPFESFPAEVATKADRLVMTIRLDYVKER